MGQDERVLALMVPPNSEEAEQALIGGVLLDNRAFERVSWLPCNAFYQDRHRRLWEVLARLIEANRPADVVTIPVAMGGEVEKIGGGAYIAALLQSTSSAVGVHRYAEIVRDKAMLRDLAQVGTEIAEQALSAGSVDVGVLVDEAESRILAVAESSARREEGPKELKTVLARVFERLDELHSRDNKSDVTGVPTGFLDLDSKTSGLQPGDLIVIAGRPSMGKTALAINIAEHVGLECGLPVAIFSMEMGDTQLGQRLLSSVARVDAHKLRTGKLADADWAAVTDAMEKLHERPIHIDDGGALSALQIRARARRLKRKHGGKLGLVVIDYLQLMSSPSKGEHRAQEVSEISRSLKAMAKELQCPVIALSQLNRAVDSRPDRRPVMSDLRESGAIEQDADLILFIYREAVYTPDLPLEQQGCTELIIGKQRNGPIGTVKLIFRGQYTRFENYQDPSFDGSNWPTRRNVSKARRANSFYDVKQAAGGPDAA